MISQKKHHLERVSKLTGKFLNNDYVKKAELATEISRRITDAYYQHKKSGLFNKAHPELRINERSQRELNKQGEQHALEARKRIGRVSVAQPLPPPMDERQIAENIAQNMNYRN